MILIKRWMGTYQEWHIVLASRQVAVNIGFQYKQFQVSMLQQGSVVADLHLMSDVAIVVA